MRKATLLLLITSLFYLTQDTSTASIHPSSESEKLTLSNGLTVILAPIDASPIVYIAVCVNAGSIYEDEYLGCGISHFVEHTLTESTHNMTHEEIERMRDKMGGIENAYTTYDHTCYHITITPKYLSNALYLLSSYIMYSAFEEFFVNQEREVILREITMGEDEPDNVIYKKFIETMMSEHPMRYPIIGCTELFKTLTRDDLVKYYERMYHPENTTVIIAGGFDKDSATTLIDNYFSEWERKPNRNPIIRDEYPQISQRRIYVDKESGLSHLFIGFHTVSITHPDMYPLDVLSTILGGSESSLLQREIIQKKGLAYNVYSYSYTPHFGGGYLGIYAMCEPGKEMKLENAILNVLGNIEKEVSEQGIITAKRRMRRRYELAIQTPEDKAQILISNELSTGDIEFTNTYLSNIEKVEKEDIINVWEKYLTRDNMTVAVLGKEELLEEISYEIPSFSQKHWTDDIIYDTLSNGIRYLIREDYSSSVLSIQLVTLGGVRIETEGNNGISNLLLNTLIRSTEKRETQEINQILDDMGTSFKPFVGNNTMGISIDVVKEDSERGIALLSEIINFPSFDEIEPARKEILGKIEKQNEQPAFFAINKTKGVLYSSHPYSLNPIGRREVVENLTRKDLNDFYAAYLPTKEIVISIFGNTDKEEVKILLERYLGNIKEKKKVIPVSMSIEFPDSSITTEVAANFGQVVVCIAFPGIDNKNYDRFAFDVMDAVLTGSRMPSGWLHQALRGEGKGYAYWMQGGNITGIDGGMYYLIAGTTEEYLETVKEIMLDLVKRIKESQVTEEEIEVARTRCIMANATSQQKNSDMGLNSTLNEIYGLGYDADRNYESNIMKISPSDINKIANKYLNEYVMVVLTSKANKDDSR